MNCDDTHRALLARQVVDSDTQTHIDQCPGCQAFAELTAAAMGADEMQDVPAHLDDRVLFYSRMRLEEPVRGRSERYRLWIAAAALVICMLCAETVIMSPRPGEASDHGIASRAKSSMAETAVSSWDDDSVDTALLQLEAELLFDDMASDVMSLDIDYDLD